MLAGLSKNPLIGLQTLHSISRW